MRSEDRAKHLLLQYKNIGSLSASRNAYCRDIRLLVTPHRTKHESGRGADLLCEAHAEIRSGDGQRKGSPVGWRVSRRGYMMKAKAAKKAMKGIMQA